MSTQTITPEMWAAVIERIATIEETLRRHDEREEEMKERQKQILNSIKEIENFIARINGGAKALVWVAGLFATLGSALTWLTSHITIPWKS